MNGDRRIVVQYARVSTDYQSVDSQRAALEEMEQKCQSKVVKMAEVVSGRRMTGPKLQELRKMVENNKVKAVHVYHVDRLGRNLLEGCKFLDLCRAHNCRLFSHCQPWDETTPEGRLMFQSMLMWAEYFLGNLSRATAKGLDEAKKRGTFVGGTKGKWMSAKVARLVERILQLSANDVSRKDIAKIVGLSERTVAAIVNNEDDLPTVRERVWDK